MRFSTGTTFSDSKAWLYTSVGKPLPSLLTCAMWIATAPSTPGGKLERLRDELARLRREAPHTTSTSPPQADQR